MAYSKEHYLKNKAYFAAYNKEYRKEYYNKNKAYFTAYSKEYRKNNREALNEYNRLYRINYIQPPKKITQYDMSLIKINKTPITIRFD